MLPPRRATARTALGTALGVTLATAVCADAPRVLVDTLPLQSLTAQIMAGAGAPDLLLAPGASPHDFALRPSDARRLSEADLLIWIGPVFLPWLPVAIATLAPEAASLALILTPGWPALPLRNDPAFETEHPSEASGAEPAGHIDAATGVDPHAWLDPQVAALWGGLIAAQLADIDPENAALYRRNADEMARDLALLEADIARLLAAATPHGPPRYFVSHDAYQYFESRFGVPAAGAISLSDNAAPGPVRLAALRDDIVAAGVTCILTDPDAPPARAQMLTDGTDVRIVMADPDGVTLTPGPALYGDLMRDLAAALAECLTPPG